MRPQIVVSLAFALSVAATGASAQDPERVQTTKDANEGSLAGAVSAPLRDVNVVRTKVPQVLLDAMADPYGRPRKPTCVQLIAMIRPLDDALGPDIDAPVQDDKDTNKTTAMGAVAGLASDVIPFRGFVRKLSGAERHDNFVQSAIIAGNVRRAYLKGLGESRSCRPPATPSHVLAGTPSPNPPGGPRYPIR